MTKYAIRKWNENKEKLREKFEEGVHWNDCSYTTLVKEIVRTVLNEGDSPMCGEKWDDSNITTIDNGHYQGTLLFVIPLDSYQPDAGEYIITFVDYGSCSGCDTLQSILFWGEGKLTQSQVDDFMQLSKDIVMNIKKPYNVGWRYVEEFDEVEI